MTLKKTTQRLAQQLFGAIAFYTTIPISARWTLKFTQIACWSPWIGLLIGGILALSDILLQPYFPVQLRSAVVVMVWISITGALHLDGAMDTADGLGVWSPEKRLEVMADSRSGAFGVTSAIAIVLLKVLSITVLPPQRWIALLWLPVWGRWAHVLAVGQYPYLKSQGNARMHHEDFHPIWGYVPGVVLHGLILTGCWLKGVFPNWIELLGMTSVAIFVSWATGFWFFRQFRGMTGDIHGAIVEWTETLLLLFWVGVYRG